MGEFTKPNGSRPRTQRETHGRKRNHAPLAHNRGRMVNVAKTNNLTERSTSGKKKHEARHNVEEDENTIRNTIARRKYTENEIWAYGDYAQSRARLPDAVSHQIRSPERHGNQGAYTIRPDLPRPVRIEPRKRKGKEKKEKGKRKQRTKRRERERKRKRPPNKPNK